MPIPQPKPPGVFNHSSYQHKWDCHGRGQVLDRHGSVYRSTAGVLCVPESAGRTSRCGTTGRLGSGLEGSSRGWRATRKSGGFDALRILVHQPIVPCLSAEACAPVRLRNSDKRFSFRSNNFRKRCIHRSRCKLRLSVTNPCRTARILFAFPAPCCQ